jgi:hypothetical protein
MLTGSIKIPRSSKLFMSTVETRANANSIRQHLCYMRSTSLARAYVRQKTQSPINALPLARAYREV